MDVEQKNHNPPLKLDTLGDVERALQRLAYKVDRCKMNLDKANCLRSIYQVLVSVKQDRRDNRFQKRVNVLWAKMNGAAPKPREAEHEHDA